MSDGYTSVRSYSFYRDNTTNVLTTNFVDTAFVFVDDLNPERTFVSTSIIIANDSGGSIEFSLDGIGIHGRVKSNEVMTFDKRHIRKIWFRGAGLAYRFWAW